MKAKTLLFFSLIFFFAAFTSFADKVEQVQAQKVAKNYFFQRANQFEGPVAYHDIVIHETLTYSRNGEPVYYVFNLKNGGFVIVSAEDALDPVLGYSYDGYFKKDLDAENVKGLMDGYADHVEYLRANSIQASPEIAKAWSTYSVDNPAFEYKKGAKDIDELLPCLWNQDFPYNIMCPEDPAGPGGHVYVGCVATAMAQIMYYWRYPIQGSGSKTYYAYPYGPQTVDFGQTTYDWNGMINSADNKPNMPIAEIGYHCAVSVSMQFGADGSGAYSSDVPYAASNYFNYSNSIQYLQRAGINITTWEGYLTSQLDNLWPVYYSGRDAGGGHAFVCDGYEDDGSDLLFHFNFGWSGSYNGWYLCTDAGGFSIQQGMVRNFIPDMSNYPYYCSGNPEMLDAPFGSLEDGSGPADEYESNTDCSWLISPQTAEDSIKDITLTFHRFETDGSDMVKVYDGGTTSAPMIGEYSGNTLPDVITASGNELLITFQSDGSSNADGWFATYSTTSPTWCSGLTTLTEPEGDVEDGSGTFNYKNGTTCMWLLEPAWANTVTIEFSEFDTEEDVDILKIYDASNNELLAEYSGYYPNGPDPVTSPSGALFMTFSSNSFNTGPGWVGYYQADNVGVEDTREFEGLQVYPNPTSDQLNIYYEIEGSQATAVKISSITGETIYEQSDEQVSGKYFNTIDLENVKPGIYFLTIKNDHGTVNKKIVVK